MAPFLLADRTEVDGPFVARVRSERPYPVISMGERDLSPAAENTSPSQQRTAFYDADADAGAAVSFITLRAFDAAARSTLRRLTRSLIVSLGNSSM